MECLPSAVLRIDRGLDDDSRPDSSLDVAEVSEVTEPWPERTPGFIDVTVEPIPFVEEYGYREPFVTGGEGFTLLSFEFIVSAL